MLDPLASFLADRARGHRRLFVAAIITISIVMWAAAGTVMWFMAGVIGALPDDAELRSIGDMSRATEILDKHDAPAFTIFKERRIAVPIDQVSPNLVKALLTIEDQRFFDHAGVDVIRIVGAALNNLRDGWGTQGGSTLTQQLARQSFLTREKTLRRKVTEILVAVRLESAFTKREILELYLNKVYFGDGLYGAEAASLGYFGKHAKDLNVADAALLAGLVKAPSTQAPTVSLPRAVARRNAVLDAMRAGHVIDEATYHSAVREQVKLVDTLRSQESFGQYFKEEVRKQLVQQFGWDRVYMGGLKVYTTLDLDMQKAAETEVMRAVADIEKHQGPKWKSPAPLQAALVALDPRSGEIRAMVGGRSFDESHFNRATQARRQAGSAFKPFVYAAALERGYTPASLIMPLDTPIMTLQGAWVPDDHSDGGPMTMREALRESSNRAAVTMLQEIGISTAVSAASRLGITDAPSVPSMALGSGEVTPLAMTAAYAAFANGGMRPTPTLIRRVETADGEVLFSSSPHAERAISEASAFLMTAMLAGVVDGGTAWQARNVGFRLPAAGKTGTTNDYKDAWFIGYTPSLVTGVWLGYDQPRTITARGYAGDLAVPLWGRFMAAATRNDTPEPFRPPRTVTTATICRLSGKLATPDDADVEVVDDHGVVTHKSTIFTEYFVRGTEPVEYCDWHTHSLAPPAIVASAGPAAPADSAAAVPVAVSTTGALAPPVAVPTAPPVAASPTPGAQTAPDPPRRGFWGRLFRRK